MSGGTTYSRRDYVQDVFNGICCALLVDATISVPLIFESHISRFHSGYLFLRLVCAAELFSFLSLHIQIIGLCGGNGLVPVRNTLLATKQWLERTKVCASAPAESLTVPLAKLFLLFIEPAVASDTHLTFITAASMVSSAIGIIHPHPIVFCFLFFTYYTLKRITGQFTGLQWDALILEVNILAALLVASLSIHSAIAVAACMWLFRLLLFRLMFGSGVVKLASGDPAWSVDYSAMTYHFLTQPLPNGLSPYTHALPAGWLKAMTLGTMIIELPLPLLSLLPIRWLQAAVAVLYLQLQISIAATGNFGFFNCLTAILGLSLCDDKHIATLYSLYKPVQTLMMGVMPTAISPILSGITQEHTHTTSGSTVSGPTSVIRLATRAVNVSAILAIAALIAVSNVCSIAALLNRKRGGGGGAGSIRPGPKPSVPGSGPEPESGSGPAALPLVGQWLPRGCWYIHEALSALCIGGHYGLFAVMTKVRREIIIEVEVEVEVEGDVVDGNANMPVSDGTPVTERQDRRAATRRRWFPVEFAFKPGSVDRAPRTVWPPMHMPRLDWRLWFVGLSPYGPAGIRGCPIYHNGESSFPVPAFPLWMWNFLTALSEMDQEENRHVLSLLHPTLNSEWISAARARVEGEADVGATSDDRSSCNNGSGSSRSRKSSISGGGRMKRVRVSVYDYKFAYPTKKQKSTDSEAGQSAAVTDLRGTRDISRPRAVRRSAASAPATTVAVDDISGSTAPVVDKDGEGSFGKKRIRGIDEKTDAVKEPTSGAKAGGSSSENITSASNISPAASAEEAAGKKKAAVTVVEGAHWRAELVAVVLPAVTLEQLYELSEQRAFNLAQQRQGGQRGQREGPPTPETAEEIIKRALMKLRKNKRI